MRNFAVSLRVTELLGVVDVGEKKLSKVIVPDKWKEGASNTQESGGRKINENKLLSKKKRFVLLNYFFRI